MQQIEPLVPALEPAESARHVAEPQRLLSLDVFRGMTIAAMVLVNNPGSWDDVYAPLAHAEWNGWTIADLIFPFFLFIVGVAINLSLRSRASRAAAGEVLPRILRRSVGLFFFGLLLNALMNFDGLASLRIPGVLQRIALCYLVTSIVFLQTGPASQAALLVGVTAGYWLLLVVVPVPGGSGADLDPEHNVVAYVDRHLLGARHLYHETWDPEGLLSTVPAVGTTLFGVLAGHGLLAKRSPLKRSLGLAAAGAVAVALGQVMSLWMPINKSLWTSSYVVFTAGVALVLFALCYWLVDVRKVRRPLHPLMIFGVNPIAVYVCSMAVGELLDRAAVGHENLRVAIRQALFDWWASPRASSLLFAFTYVLVWLGVMEVLYRRKVFIKI